MGPLSVGYVGIILDYLNVFFFNYQSILTIKYCLGAGL